MTDISGALNDRKRLQGFIRGAEGLSGHISNIENLNGNIVTVTELKGTASTVSYLRGTICAVSQLSGSINKVGGLRGIVSSAMSHSDIEIYSGPYIATPTLEEQIFPTKFKKMSDDMTVNATPISDVRTVDTDGYTITIL